MVRVRRWASIFFLHHHHHQPPPPRSPRKQSATTTTTTTLSLFRKQSATNTKTRRKQDGGSPGRATEFLTTSACSKFILFLMHVEFFRVIQKFYIHHTMLIILLKSCLVRGTALPSASCLRYRCKLMERVNGPAFRKLDRTSA